MKMHVTFFNNEDSLGSFFVLLNSFLFIIFYEDDVLCGKSYFSLLAVVVKAINIFVGLNRIANNRMNTFIYFLERKLKTVRIVQ